MDTKTNLAPPVPLSPPKTPTPTEPAPADERASSKFSQMLAAVETHRTRVRAALGVALLARVLFEFNGGTLLRSSRNLMVQVPYIGLAMLAYLLVLMWLSARTRDRFGFGMALGIGVLEATYLLALSVMQRPFTFGGFWPPLVVAIAHVPMAVFAFQSSAAYPPLDSKRPWIVGFVAALVLLSIPWIAPTVLGSFG